MKYILVFVFSALILVSCNTDDESSEPSTIEIGEYRLTFPTKFLLEPVQGIDSYVGNVNGNGVSLIFDYGYYSGPSTQETDDDYLVTTDDYNGYYRQIVKPVNSQFDYTRLHMFKISDTLNGQLFYNSLTFYTNNISSNNQDMLISVFENVEVVE